MLKLIVISFLILLSFVATASKEVTIKADSLKELISALPADSSEKLFSLNTELFYLYFGDFQYAIGKHYLNQCRKLAKNSNNVRLEVSVYGMEAMYFFYTEQLDKGIKSMLKSTRILLALGDSERLADNYMNLGVILTQKSETYEALGFLNQGLVYTNDSSTIASIYASIGMAYMELGNNAKGLDYQLKAMKYLEALKDTFSMSAALHNLALTYSTLQDEENALIYYNQSLEMSIEHDILFELSFTYQAIGDIYMTKTEYRKALKYFLMGRSNCYETKSERSLCLNQLALVDLYLSYLKSVRDKEKIEEKLSQSQEEILIVCKLLLDSADNIANKIHDHRVIVLSLTSQAYYYGYIKNWSRAIDLLKAAEKIGTSMSLITVLPEIYGSLSECYEKTASYKLALAYKNKHMAAKDSTLTKDILDKTSKKTAQYEFEKKEQYRLAQEEKDKLIAAAQHLKDEIIQLASYGGLAVSLAFLLILYNRFRITRKQKNVIQEQKNLVDEQKKDLATKNEQITLSINYASRIQSAILPDQQMLNSFFGDSCLVYLPKAIVSGDFYWIDSLNPDQIIWAVADCTGHGVPGGFMSMIGSSLLNKIIHENKIQDPGQILNQLREGVIEWLHQEKEGVDNRDGMAVSLCYYDKSKKQLQYACAENSFIVIREAKIIDLIADSQNISIHLGRDKFADFKTEIIDLESGDSVYIYSDGFVDQKGGERNKKYYPKRFKEFLLSINHLPMREQQGALIKEFDNWKSGNTQIDDVCIVGVKID